jgi:hypothetical protein
LTLARSGVWCESTSERTPSGIVFFGDFLGLENWSSLIDAIDRLAALGVEPTFVHRPYHEVTFYDSKVRPALTRSTEPLFYLVRSGPEEGSLDRALASQAAAAGAELLLVTGSGRSRPW